MKKNLVTPSELRQVADHLVRTNTYYVAGSHSIYVPSYKAKYVNQTIAKPWPNLDGYYERMTPGEAARTELTREFPTLKRVGWPGPAVSLLDIRSPLHYSGPSRHFCTYLDLTGAYCQIYRCLWLDVCYPRSFYGKYPLVSVADRLEVWKAARNSLVGVTRSRGAVGVRGHKRIPLKIKNRFLAPPFWATVQEILHMVASVAIEFGAIYINTDGYLFPFGDCGRLDDFMLWLADAGFIFHVRAQGAGHVKGWNSYSVGKFSTKPYKLDLETRSKEFSNVRRTETDRWAGYWGNVQAIVRDGNGR